jgi:hypothetical protein
MDGVVILVPVFLSEGPSDMYLDRVTVVIQVQSTATTEAFLSRDDIKRGKLGSVTTIEHPDRVRATQLVQTDSFMVVVRPDLVQVQYSIPAERHDMDDHPINHLADRFRRLSRSLGESGDGMAAWTGLLSFFREPDRQPTTGAASISNWLKEKGSPAADENLAAFQFMRGVNRGAWFEGVTVQGYEIHTTSIQSDRPPTLPDIVKAPISETGIEFTVDVNNRPANKPERIGTMLMEFFRHVEGRYVALIDEISQVIGRQAQ